MRRTAAAHYKLIDLAISKAVTALERRDFDSFNYFNELVKKHLAIAKGIVYKKTKIIIVQSDYDFADKVDVVDCCKVGPIVSENYCPKCGAEIVR